MAARAGVTARRVVALGEPLRDQTNGFVERNAGSGERAPRLREYDRNVGGRVIRPTCSSLRGGREVKDPGGRRFVASRAYRLQPFAELEAGQRTSRRTIRCRERARSELTSLSGRPNRTPGRKKWPHSRCQSHAFTPSEREGDYMALVNHKTIDETREIKKNFTRPKRVVDSAGRQVFLRRVTP